MARKIVIASGKGGAGKSSLAAGLGGALAGMGKHILLIDCDIGLRSLDLILGCAENTVYDWADVLLGRCAPEKAPLSVGGLHLLAAPLRDTPAFTPGAMHSLTAQYDAFFDDILEVDYAQNLMIFCYDKRCSTHIRDFFNDLVALAAVCSAVLLNIFFDRISSAFSYFNPLVIDSAHSRLCCKGDKGHVLIA